MDQARKYTLKELAALTGSTLSGDPNYQITGVDALESASCFDASFLANPKYKDALLKSLAGVICIQPDVEQIPGKNYLISYSPSETFQKIVELFLITENNESAFIGIHPTAVVHPDAKIGKDVSIGPYAVIDKGCTIGDGTLIMAHVCICAGVKIGNSCRLYPHAVVREKCILGSRVTLQPGAIVGSCGFGYSTDAKGVHTKLDQLGIVIIEDDVEVGSCTTIDRARFKATTIRRNTKIDNLVQIGHNVELGPSNLIVSQTGIAGSTKTGRNVVMGGQTGVVGHIEIGDGVMLAAKSGVSKDLPPTGVYSGVPVLPIKEYNRQQVYLRNIEKYVKKIADLEARLDKLEKS